MTSGDYRCGSLILVWNNYLDFQFGNKGALRWQGPYVVVQRRPSGAYILAELDGTVFTKPFTARCLKLYHFWDIKVPIVREEWQTNVEDLDIMDEYIEGDEDEYVNDRLARARAKQIIRVQESPKLPHPLGIARKTM